MGHMIKADMSPKGGHMGPRDARMLSGLKGAWGLYVDNSVNSGLLELYIILRHLLLPRGTVPK